MSIGIWKNCVYYPVEILWISYSTPMDPSRTAETFKQNFSEIYVPFTRPLKTLIAEYSDEGLILEAITHEEYFAIRLDLEGRRNGGISAEKNGLDGLERRKVLREE